MARNVELPKMRLLFVPLFVHPAVGFNSTKKMMDLVFRPTVISEMLSPTQLYTC